MIAVNIQGGLGNQLFEYAFAYAAAKKLRTNFVLDNSESFIVPEFFTTSKIDVLVNRIPYVRRIYREQVRKLRNNNYIDCSDCWQKQGSDMLNSAYYDGYFQSIACFDLCQNKIRKLYRVRNRYKREFNEKYGELFRTNKTLIVHIRRGDYLMHGVGKNLGADDLSLPMSYYQNALKKINDVQQYKILIVGEDMAWARMQFAELPGAQLVSNSAIVDFQLIMNADVVIGSNSTFAWWASFLNPKQNKRIIMPQYFLGYHVKKEFPNGIYYNTCFEQIEM